MSRLTFPGTDPRQCLVIGVDTTSSHPSFFGQLEQASEQGEQTEGTTLVRVHGGTSPLHDLQQVVKALQPYGEIPLLVQLHLLDELDKVALLPLIDLGRQLVAICQQAPEAHLTIPPTLPEQTVLALTDNGWQILPWPGGDSRLPHLLYPDLQDAPLDFLSGYTSVPGVLVITHDEGASLQFPVMALTVHGAAFCGPTALANENRGLSARHVHALQHEIFWVPPALRDQVSVLWHRACQTLRQRGYTMSDGVRTFSGR